MHSESTRPHPPDNSDNGGAGGGTPCIDGVFWSDTPAG
jgi:hypothetical protein